MRQNASYSDPAPNFPPIHFNYIINGSPIQAINCHCDLGILISSDLKWSNHLMFISSRAYNILALIRCSFSSGLHVSAKKNLYMTLIRSQLIYASQIWRPHLINDILALERIQPRVTKYILNVFHSDYVCTSSVVPQSFTLDDAT